MAVFTINNSVDCNGTKIPGEAQSVDLTSKAEFFFFF